MVVCCRCVKTGVCKGCSCVRAGVRCSDCYSSRVNRCQNQNQNQTVVADSIGAEDHAVGTDDSESTDDSGSTVDSGSDQW